MNNFSTVKILANIDDVVPNGFNPNQMSKELFEKEVNSIKELGLMGSILVRDYAGCYQILDGEHRWRACKDLGYTQIQVENLGEIDDNQAKMLTILLNNLRGKDDIEKRAKLFEELNKGQLQLLPFTEEEIENEKALFKFDFSQYDKQEVIPDRIVNNTLCFGLSKEERDLWDKTIQYAKDKEKKTDIQWLMRAINEYLELRISRDNEGNWKF